MFKPILMISAVGLSLAGCSAYDNDRQVRSAGTGAAIGAAGGAVAGAVIGGVSPVEGAIAGAVTGGVVGAVTGGQRDWQRDDRGYCYYVNDRGQRVYGDRDTRC